MNSMKWIFSFGVSFFLCVNLLSSPVFGEDANDAKVEMTEAFQRGIDEVAASGILETAVNVGDEAPDFTLPDALGREISLESLLEKGPVVLVWYRGGWCPYCNVHLNSLKRVLPQIKKAGAQLVAISPELPDKSLTTQQKHQLEFPVLSDAGNQVAKKYGVVFKLPDYVAKYYDQMLSLPEYNGDDSYTLPLAAAYVIDAGGTVTYAFLDADYKNRAEPEALLHEVIKINT